MSSALKYIFKKDAKILLDNFSSLFGIRIGFHTINHIELTVGENREICSFCNLVQNTLNLKKKCIELDKKKAEEAINKKTLLRYYCHAGLLETILPIFIHDSFIGYIMMGQIRTKKNYPLFIRNEWLKKYKNTNELDNCFNETVYIPSEKLNSIIKFFQLMVDYIVSNNMIKLKRFLIADKILDYINKNIGNNISITDVAGYVNRSPNSVYQTVKKIFNKSFKRLVINLKLEKAENLLLSYPDMNITEIAGKIGYNDAFYFSRLFKKYRKVSPNIFRNRALK